MAKTKQEKIDGIQEQIAQLENQKKRLLQEQKLQERKNRTKRLCQRARLLESLMPDTVPLTDEQFKLFLDKTMSDFAHRILAEIKAGQLKPAAVKPAEAAARDNPTAAARPPQTAQSNAANEGKDGGNGARVTG